jgi:hypothetical protein
MEKAQKEQEEKNRAEAELKERKESGLVIDPKKLRAEARAKDLERQKLVDQKKMRK